jgi:hypothetical protein
MTTNYFQIPRNKIKIPAAFLRCQLPCKKYLETLMSVLNLNPFIASKAKKYFEIKNLKPEYGKIILLLF